MTQNEVPVTQDPHWDSYYSKASPPDLPSQFCVFVANELGSPATVVEFGCGNGRDSLFFVGQQWNVIGVDASESAVESCKDKVKGRSARAARFVQMSVSDPECYETIARIVREFDAEGPLLVYARFFMHAIDEKSQAMLLDGARNLLDGRKGVFAVEFRTKRDANLSKVTASHYRRFINSSDFAIEASERGFDVQYFVEGFGFAKYKDDDAHVARFILSPKDG